MLPEAPLPAGQTTPFLRIEGAGGRSVIGLDQELRFLSGASSKPIAVELETLQSVELSGRPFLEALVLVAGAFILALVALSWLPLVIVLGGLGFSITVQWRWYSLVLKTREGKQLRWPLGLLWVGSRRARELEAAWSSAARALASRGVSARGASEARGPGA
jgi:hypothetical protein